MDSDHSKPPSRHPSSSSQRKHHHHHHHRPSTASTAVTSGAGGTSEDDNYVAALKRRDRQSGLHSGSKSKSVLHSFEVNEDKYELEMQGNNPVESVKVRPKHREVGKVKPIRIISTQEAPSEDANRDEKLKLIKSTSAWEEEPSGDNQKRRSTDSEDIKDVETQEKMFITTSELGPTKYYSKSTGNKSSGENEDTIIYEDDDENCIVKDNNNHNSDSNSNTVEELRKDATDNETKGDRSSSRRRNSRQVKRTDEEAEEESQGVRAVSAPVMHTSSTGMSTSSSSCSERVKVIVRCRPMSNQEKNQGHEW